MVMKRHKRIAASATTYILLIIALVWTIFPVYWMIKSSITVNSEMYVARPSLIAKHYTFENYVDLFTKTEFPRALFKQSYDRLFDNCLLSADQYSWLLCYDKTEISGKKIFSKQALSFSYLIPTAVLFVPMYVFVSKLGFYDNKWALLIIYPTTVVPYCCYMLMSYFKAIPYALEEAALIDGCTRMKSLRYIITPIALPGIAVVATFAFTMSWNEYLYAMIMTTSPAQQTAVVAISSFKYADSAIWGRIMAASVLTSLPVTIIYIVAQAQLI